MKNKSFLYNITALVAVMAAVALSGCVLEDDTQPQRKITILDISTDHNGKTVNLALTALQKDTAYGEAVISNGTARVPLMNVNNEPFTGNGVGLSVELTITDATGKEESHTATISISKETTYIEWDEFKKVDSPKQKKIAITNVPFDQNGKTISLVITQLTKNKAHGEATISSSNTNSTVEVSLKNDSGESFTGSGVGFGIEFTITGTGAEEESYTLKSLTGKAIYEETTTVSWNDFSKVVAPQTPPQKKIVITNIPSDQIGRSISLTLLQSDTEKATASDGTKNGTSITFEPKANNQAFTGIGLFTVKLTVTSSPPSQTVTREAIKLITKETTNMSWADFRITEVN